MRSRPTGLRCVEKEVKQVVKLKPTMQCKEIEAEDKDIKGATVPVEPLRTLFTIIKKLKQPVFTISLPSSSSSITILRRLTPTPNP